MFERFTADARDAVLQARTVADSLGDRTIDREHLLVGLTIAGDPALVEVGFEGAELQAALRDRHEPDDAEALGAVGIDVTAIKDAVERNLGPNAWDEAAPKARRDSPFLARLLPNGGSRFSPGAKKTLELALREALADKSRELTTTHVLRGLLRDPGDTVSVLISSRTSVADLRERARGTH